MDREDYERGFGEDQPLTFRECAIQIAVFVIGMGVLMAAYFILA